MSARRVSSWRWALAALAVLDVGLRLTACSPFDGGSDPATDAGTDAGADATTVGVSVADAGASDGGTETETTLASGPAPGVSCGEVPSCLGVCCAARTATDVWVLSCKPSSSDCAKIAYGAMACDDDLDCGDAGRSLCCGTLAGGKLSTTCTSGSACPASSLHLCNRLGAACSANTRCTATDGVNAPAGFAQCQ